MAGTPGAPGTSGTTGTNAMFARIRWRLVAWTMLVLGLILLALGSAVYVALSRSLLNEVDRNLAGRADQAAEDPAAALSGEREGGREGYDGGVFYLVVDSVGRIIANPQQVNTSGLHLPPAGARSRTYLTQVLNGEPVRLFTHPIVTRGRSVSLLVVGQSLAPEQDALDLLLLILGLGGGVGLLLSLAGAWFLAGRALVPIEQAFWRQQAFVADASHELRTPLTVLRTATDLLDQHRDEPLAANGELFDDIRQEITRMERLSGDLLTLARSDRGEVHLAVAPVDLAALAGDVVRRVTPLAQSKGITITSRSSEPPPIVEADPDRLQQVLLILLDNAIRHTPAGGRIEVGAQRQGADAILRVADTGTGIAAEHLPRIFERFYRADPSRTPGQGGAGLGLAIAKSLVEAHGGRLAVESAPGAGTRVTIRLRPAPPQRLWDEGRRACPERSEARNDEFRPSSFV